MWLFVAGVLKTLIGPVFEFLNKRLDTEAQIHITTTKAIADAGAAGLAAVSKADELNAQVRMSQGAWGPVTICMMIILAPLVWHEWQVALDSSRWVPVFATWYGIPYVTVAEHRVGSWGIAKLPGAWDAVELAIFQSFFIGAAASLSTIAVIKALRK